MANKSERIEIRVTAKQKSLLEKAAESKHISVSEFILRYGVAAAEKTLSKPTVWRVLRLIDATNSVFFQGTKE